MVRKPGNDYAGENYGHHGTSYSFESVIGDLIDNSIDADAEEVNIVIQDQTYPYEGALGVNDENYPEGLPYLSGEHLYAMVIDNGKGMSANQLDDAIVMGKKRKYEEYELGHYGVGMKQSSLSQAYEMTIFTKSKSEISILRLSSTWIQEENAKGWLEVKDMEGKYAWMKETDGFKNAMSELDDLDNHGTIILLEGLHKLEARITSRQRDTSIEEVIKRVENFLRLTFSDYIKPGGADIPLSKEIDGKMTYNRALTLRVLNQKLMPLCPFYKDLVNEEDPYGTLNNDYSIETVVNRTKNLTTEMKVNVWIIPNSSHPTYKARVVAREKNLKDSGEGLNAQKLQGLYLYRNMRLIDYGKDQWKDIRGEDPGQTMHRWEVHLPPGLHVGNITMTDFLVNNTKSEVKVHEDMKTRFKDMSANSATRWHDKDPAYVIAAMTRAQIRNKKEGRNQSLAARFGKCNHCGLGDHKTADHKCPDCGKGGHKDKSSNRCKKYVPPPPPPPPPPMVCSDCSNDGHDSKNSLLCPLYKPPELPDIPPDPSPGFGYSFSIVREGDLIQLEDEGDKTIVKVNILHPDLKDFMDSLDYEVIRALRDSNG